ncbi:hypothetical protein PLIP_a0757 [Pseudoalteromonas lipolytica LMEB 39]|nr:hypothetical protein [Pseudoalteromonas lipolytica LMEB 39]
MCLTKFIIFCLLSRYERVASIWVGSAVGNVPVLCHDN